MNAATRPLISLPDELWMPVTGYEDIYLISDLGLPHSVDRIVRRSDGRTMRVKGQPLSTRNHASNGFYPMVGLSRNGLSRQHYIHRLVLEAFRGPCPPGMEVRHLNGDPSDARLVNLEYGPHSENIRDQVRHGTHRWSGVTHCPFNHLLEAPNLVKARLPNRICLACARARQEVYRNRELGIHGTHQAISDRKYAAIMAGDVPRRDRNSEVCLWGHPLAPPNLVPLAKSINCLACSRTYGVVQRAKARGETPDFQVISDQKLAVILAEAS